jgi:hypothetical protein
MAEDETRRVLKLFGVAVTDLEDAVASGQAAQARKAAAELSERMKDVTALVERLTAQAASL